MLTKLLTLFFSLYWISDNARSTPDQVSCSYYYSKALKKNVYTRVEIVPEFPGGEAAYQRFLNRNVRCTDEMIDEGTWQSTVIFTFIVDTDGKIKHPTFRGNEDSTYFNPLEKEVNRALKLMPQWITGKCRKKPVASEVKRSMVVCLGRD